MWVLALTTLWLFILYLFARHSAVILRSVTSTGWRLAEAHEVPHLVEQMHEPHLLQTSEDTADDGGDNLLPYVNVGLRARCRPLPRLRPTRATVGEAFMQWLQSAAINNFVDAFAEPSKHASWRLLDTTKRHRHEAVYEYARDAKGVVAWARLVLPDSRSLSVVRRASFATLVVHVEIRSKSGHTMPPTDLIVWRSRLREPFALMDAFGSFLRKRLRLGLGVHSRVFGGEQDQEPDAEIGALLFSRPDISKLVFTGMLPINDAELPSESFSVYAMKNIRGLADIKVADAWLIDMCENPLHLRDYEDTLASIPGFVDGPIRSGLARVPVQRRVLLVVLGLSVATLTSAVIVDKTLNKGRVVNQYIFPPPPSPSPSPSPSR